MGDKTRIEWCDATWNPIAGCSATLISSGCERCYARVMAHRMGKAEQYFHGLANKDSWTGKVRFYLKKLEEPFYWKKPRKIFVCSMGDLFFSEVNNKWIDEVFGIIVRCLVKKRGHKFLILTKRPHLMFEYFFTPMLISRWAKCARVSESEFSFPLDNVWLGVSAEDQENFDRRIIQLKECPAKNRFVSIEPMLGPIDIRLGFDLDWLICGGESGGGARPLHPAWVASLRDQCKDDGIPFMFKQWGMWEPVNWYTSATHAIRNTDGTVRKIGNSMGSIQRAEEATPGWAGIVRVGKAKAGKALDGRYHLDIPL